MFVLTGVMGSGARKEVANWAGKSEIGSRVPKRTPPDPPRGLDDRVAIIDHDRRSGSSVVIQIMIDRRSRIGSRDRLPRNE